MYVLMLYVMSVLFIISIYYIITENSRHRGAWQGTVHGVAKSRHDWATNTHTEEIKLFFFSVYFFHCTGSQLQHTGSFSHSRWTLSCSMWDLVLWPGIEPKPCALGARNLSHWTTREVPIKLFSFWEKKKKEEINICDHRSFVFCFFFLKRKPQKLKC